MTMENNVTVSTESNEQILKVDYYQGTEAQMVDLALIFEYLPLGSKVTASCDSLLHGKQMFMEIDKTTAINFKYTWPNKEIPADWKTTFTITLNPGSDRTGIPPGKELQVMLRGEIVVS